MKTLIIYPPCASIMGNSFVMPLGVCYLKTFLIQNGQAATVLDLNIKMYLDSDHKEIWDEEIRWKWESTDTFHNTVLPDLDIDKWLNYILSQDADIVGFSISYSSLYISLLFAEQIKKNSNKKVVFGGAGCYEDKIEEYLRAGIDAVIVGEGEQTLLEFVKDFKLCKGVYMLQNDKVVYGGTRPLLDIDSLPIPNFVDIIDDYRKMTPNPWISSSFLRGCTNRCAFCDESPFWQRIRQRSPENIVGELAFQQSRYNAAGFNKGDSILADSPETLNKICDLMIQSNLNLQWYSQARPVKWLSFELLQKLYQAGLRGVCFGVESGSQKVLDRMNKKLDIKEIERVIQDTKKAGIMPAMTLMVDSPKENLIDFVRTILFVLKIRKHLSTFNVSVAGIPKRSDWYNNPSKYGISLDYHWHSKYYFNNYISAKIKKRILDRIKRMLIKA